MPQIVYPSRATQEVTEGEFKLIHRLMTEQAATKITAIKFAREQYGLGLYEAKKLCEAIATPTESQLYL